VCPGATRFRSNFKRVFEPAKSSPAQSLKGEQQQPGSPDFRAQSHFSPEREEPGTSLLVTAPMGSLYEVSDVSWKLSGYAVCIATERNLHQFYPRAMQDSPEHREQARLWYLLYVSCSGSWFLLTFLFLQFPFPPNPLSMLGFGASFLNRVWAAANHS
jgi:hypothetical protein